EDLEEERRLFYVALTRARKKAFLSYAVQRFRWGQVVHSEASRFIDEINPQYLDYQIKQAQTANAPEKNVEYTSPRPIQKKVVMPAYVPSADFSPEDVTGIQIGMQVE